MTEHFQEEIMYVTNTTSLDAAARLVGEGTVSELYVDAGTFSADVLARRAREFHEALRGFQIYEPVVVGPLSDDSSELITHLARLHVRSTGKSYEDYCRAAAHTRELCERCGLPPLA